MMSIGAITMLVARVLANDIASVRDTRPGLDAVQVQLHGSDEISVSVVLH